MLEKCCQSVFGRAKGIYNNMDQENARNKMATFYFGSTRLLLQIVKPQGKEIEGE